MSRNAVVLVTDTSTVADTAAKNLDAGGRYALVVSASTYPTTVALQMLDSNFTNAAKWISISANITADGVTAYDLPAGQYRIHLAGGSASHFCAALVPITYM